MSAPPTVFGMVPAATAVQLDGLTFLRNVISQRFPAPPFAQTTDIYLVEADDGRVTFEALPATGFLNPLGLDLHATG